MTYDLSNNLDRSRFDARCALLRERGSVVDLTEKAFRSSSQNRYLHLLIGLVALEVGETIDYVKTVYFKGLVNPGLFVLEVVDPYAGTVKNLRSSADLTKEEMSLAIDRFKIWGRKQGWAMPDPGDEEILRQLEVEISRHRAWM